MPIRLFVSIFMKICLINSLYPPYSRGGAENVTHVTALSLRDMGYEVLVITTDAESYIWDFKPYKLEIREGIKVCRVRSFNMTSFHDYTRKPLWFRLIWLGIDMVNPFPALSVRKILKKERPDIVHMHNTRGLSYLIPRIVKKIGLKSVMTLHDIQYVYPSGLLIRGEEKDLVNTFFLRRWYEGFCKILLKSPDVIIFPSKWLSDFYTGRGFFNESVKESIRNPVSKKPRNGYAKPLKDKKLNILYVGQAEKHKGILFAVRKMQNISTMEFRLSIVGDGSLIDDMRREFKGDDRFVFYGRVSHNEVERFYNMADALIMPTLTYENSPTVIVEAFSSSVPVIASNIGGIPELVAEGETGWLFEAGDGDSLVTTLKRAKSDIGDVEVLNHMKKRCLEESLKSDSKKYANRLVNIYSDLNVSR